MNMMLSSASALPVPANAEHLGPDAALLAACARHTAAYRFVRSLSWPRDGDAVFEAVEIWHRIFLTEIEPVAPVTAAGRDAKWTAEVLFAGPAPQG